MDPSRRPELNVDPGRWVDGSAASSTRRRAPSTRWSAAERVAQALVLGLLTVLVWHGATEPVRWIVLLTGGVLLVDATLTHRLAPAWRDRLYAAFLALALVLRSM